MSIKASKFLEKITGGHLTFGRALAAIRKCDEISQVEYAKLLGVSRQYLCDVENGRTHVSPKQAAHFAKVLRYSEKQFVQLAMQDYIDSVGLSFVVNIQEDHRRAKAA